jgi:hypothetical protein
LIRRQRGGALGTLIVLIALAVIGYYVYQHFLGSESNAPPSCQSALNSCIADCRRYSSSDASENEACQKRCREQAAACEAK